MMEIFTFLQIGASMGRIDLIAVKGGEAAIRKDVDVRQAQCYNALQRDQLFAVIEAGFGNLGGFNDAISGVVQALRRAHQDGQEGGFVALSGDAARKNSVLGGRGSGVGLRASSSFKVHVAPADSS